MIRELGGPAPRHLAVVLEEGLEVADDHEGEEAVDAGEAEDADLSRGGREKSRQAWRVGDGAAS